VTARRVPPSKADLTTKKFCTKCSERKVLDDFHIDNKRKDGRQVWCRLCMNRVMKKIMRDKAAELRTFRLLKRMISVAEQETALK
jgi:superfamily II helicase